jgi:hypothetical protein
MHEDIWNNLKQNRPTRMPTPFWVAMTDPKSQCSWIVVVFNKQKLDPEMKGKTEKVVSCKTVTVYSCSKHILSFFLS